MFCSSVETDPVIIAFALVQRKSVVLEKGTPPIVNEGDVLVLAFRSVDLPSGLGAARGFGWLVVE